MSKTAEGLRDRLFDTLDALLEGKIDKDTVEAVCYTSEQIIKSAQVELEFTKEMNSAKADERNHIRRLKQDEAEATARLQMVLDHAAVQEQ